MAKLCSNLPGQIVTRIFLLSNSLRNLPNWLNGKLLLEFAKENSFTQFAWQIFRHNYTRGRLLVQFHKFWGIICKTGTECKLFAIIETVNYTNNYYHGHGGVLFCLTTHTKSKSTFYQSLPYTAKQSTQNEETTSG